jgi:hypothetical protein
MPVDRQRRIGLVALEHEIDDPARGLERGIVERSLREHRRIARGGEQDVALAKRHLEPLGETQHHLARGLRTPGFDEAQMPRRDLGIDREVELAHAPALAPFRADGHRKFRRRLSCRNVSGRSRRLPLPPT